MAILGTLILDLSAPTAQLSRDLDRAQSLAREAASKMGGIKTVWGIASSLQDEMRASRSILNSSLKAIESDAKGYLPMVRVGVEFDGGAIDTQMQSLEREFSLRSAYLNRQVITPQVDDSQLTALNKHLSLKERHLDRVVSKFTNTKIVPNFGTNGNIEQRISVVADRDGEQKLTRSISNAIEKGLSESKGKGLGLFDGIRLSIGQSIGKALSGAIKDTTGFDISKSISSTVKTVAQPIKLFITDNSKLQSEIAKVRSDVGINLDRAGYRLADAIVAGLDKHDGNIKSRLNAFTGELFKDSTIKNEAVQAFGKINSSRKDVAKSVFNKDTLASYIDRIDTAISNRREKTIRERGIPAALKRATEIVASGKTNNTGNAVSSDTQELVIATGGYAGAKGLSGKRLQKDIKAQSPSGTEVIWVRNNDTDIPKEMMGKASTKAVALGTSLAKPNIRGYSQDATEMVGQALAAIEKNPTIKIKFIGESGGGFPAEEAAKTLQMMGHKNVEYVGVGTPDFIGGLNAPGRKIISPDEYLGAETQRFYQGMGVAKPSKGQSILGVTGHPYENYAEAGVAELANFTRGKPQELTKPELDGIKDAANQFTAIDIQSLDSNQLATVAKQAYANLQLINRHVLGAVGRKKTELEAIAKQFESVYIQSAPEPKQMTQVRAASKKAGELYANLDNNRGLDSGAKAGVIQKELIQIEKEFDALYKNSTGTIQAKYQALSQELKSLISGFQNPSLAINGSKVQATKLGADPIELEPIEVNPFKNAAEKLAQKKRERQLQRPSIWDEQPEPFEFMNAPSVSIPKKKQNVDSPDLKFDRAVDKFDRAVDKFVNDQKKETKRSAKKEEVVDGEFEYVEQSTGSKVFSAARQGLNLVSQPIGQIGSVASGAEKALFEALPILKPLKGVMQVGGTLAIGGAIAQNPVGQAAISGTSHVMQSIAGAPISQFAGMTSSAIEQILGSALTHLPGGTGLAQSIAVEVQRALQSGGAQAAGAIASVLSPYLVAKLGMSAASVGVKQLMPGLNGNDRLTDSTQRNLIGAGRKVKQLMPATTIEPYWDVEATVVDDRQLPQGKKVKALPPAKKTANPEWANIVEARLQATREKIENAIKSGEIDLARQYHAQLKSDVVAVYKMISIAKSDPAIGKEDLAQLNSVSGNLKKKSNFIRSSGDALDLMDFSDADPTDVKGKIGWSEKLKRSVAQGIRHNMGQGNNNNEAGFINLGARIPALDFLDTPVQSFKNTVGRLNPFKPRQQSPQQPIAPQPIIPDAEKSETALSKLIGVGKLALGTFGAFTALSLGVPAMISLGKSTLDTAKNFETLQVKLAAASDSAQAGKNSFKRISTVADDLGISRSGALEVGAGISGTTFGTELEGKPSDRLTDQTLEFFKLRGLSKQQQEGFQLAATQTLGRKNVSMQEVNQFTQSAGITDTRSIAARGLGMTPAQFAAAADSTGIDAKKFYSAFISQGLQDSRTGEDLASQTSQYKESKLSANNEKLAGTVGDAAMPVYKAGIDLLINSIGLLVSALENGKSMLIGFATYGVIFAGATLLKLADDFKLFQNAVALSKSLVLPSLANIVTSVIKLGATLAAFYIIGEGIQALGKKWSNAGQEIQDGADKVANALSKLNKNQPPNLNNPSTAALGWGDNPVENFGLYLQRGLSIPAAESLQKMGVISKDTEILDNKQKADREIVTAGQNVSTQVLEARFAGNQVKPKGRSMENVDRELAAIDTERSGLYSSGAPNASKIAALNKRYQEKTTERDRLNGEVAPVKTAAQEAINAVKGQQAFLDKNRGKIGEDTYISQSAQAAKDLKIAEATLLQINKDLRSSFDTLSKWVNTLDKISAKFEKIGTQANTSRELLASNRNSGEISGRLTRGGSERQSVIDTERVTTEEIKQRKLVMRELKDSLNILDKDNTSRVQTSYGINDNSSVSEINVAKNRATDDKDKTTLEKLATIKEEQLKVATLDATLSNSHAETYRRIYAENREAALYYTSLSQQIDPNGVMFAKNIAAITAEKSRFMAKLNNYGTGGFDVYTTAVIELMDLGKDRMTALAKQASDQKAALDAKNNRDNEIAGKRQNDFDTNPGSAQPSVGKVSGANAQPGSTNPPQSSTPNSQLPTPNSVEPPLPPKTIKVKRSKTFIDANGYTDSPNPEIQASIRAKLANGGYSPSAVNRYVNTTQAIGSQDRNINGRVTGYTDLAPDAWDRKYLGAPSKPGGRWTGGRSTKDGRLFNDTFSGIPANRSTKPQGSKITVQYEEEIPNPEYRRAIIAQNKRKAANSALQPAANQVMPQTSGRFTTGQLRDKSQVASDRIYDEAIERSRATMQEFDPSEALRKKQIAEKLERESRLKKQEADKQIRDIELANLNAIPTTSIQDAQKRETLSQRNSLKDNQVSVSNQRLDMKSQIENIKISIDEYNKLAAKPNRTQSEQERGERLIPIITKLAKDLPALESKYRQLQELETNLPANDEKAIAALQEQQTYNLDKQKETEEQDRRATANTQLRGKLTDIDQQLTNAPLDQDKLKNQREFNKQIVINDAEIARINSERAITERARTDASYYPKQQSSDRARVKLIEQNTIKNAGNKQAQESLGAKNTIDQEFATADIAELKLGQSSGDLGVRFAQSQDKIDAPFASTRALDLELQQKLSAIENAKIERNKQFEQQRIKYAGTSDANIKLLASLDRQKIEADRQSEVEKKVAETDSGIAVRGIQSQRKGYLYGQQKAVFNQQIGIFDAQTTGDKQRGQDTRDREYTSAVLRKKADYSQQEFDLNQQRDAITGLTPEADAARASIDGLIAGLKEMQSIELSNMANQFDRFNQVLGETQKTTQSVLEKFVKTGKFDWKSILRTPLEGGISQIMGQVTSSLFSGLYRKAPVTKDPASPDGTKPTDSVDGGQTASNLQPTQPQPIAPQASPTQALGAIAPVQPLAEPLGTRIAPQSSIVGTDGMVNVPMPGGGNYRIPRDRAISEGFMRLDGSSTSQPEVKPEIKIEPLEPQTIAAPEVTIEPLEPQTIAAPAPDDGTRYDIQQLPLRGRSNIANFKPKFDPNKNAVIAPPMPVDQFEGMSGYTGATSQPSASFSSGDAMSLASLIPGMGSAGKYMGLLGKIGGLFGMSFADGGMVPSDSKFGEFRQGNDPIGAALRKEGANSVIAALTPGERVLTVSESRYYETMFPQGIKGYADGGVVGNIKPIPLNLDQSKIDNRGDSNEFNFDIKNGGGNDAKMTKENLKEMENAVVAVLLKQKRARTGLVPS